MGLIKIIITLLFIYYAFKFLMRLFAPFLVNKVVDKMQQKAAERFNGYHKENTIKEGETVIDKKPKQKSFDKDYDADDVDFEEID